MGRWVRSCVVGDAWAGEIEIGRRCARMAVHETDARRNFTQRFLKFGGAVLVALCVLALAPGAFAQKRMVIVDQDGSGPGGSNQMAMMVLLLSPNVDVLGLTMVTGNAWRDEEMAHTLRMLELIGRTDVPVVQGAVFPLVRKEDETRLYLQMYGKVVWLGAWGEQPQIESVARIGAGDSADAWAVRDSEDGGRRAAYEGDR